MEFITLQFDKYQIRQYQLTDIDALVKYGNNYSVSRFLRDTFPFPYTNENAFQWIDFVKKNNLTLSYAIATDQEVIGGIGAIPYDDVQRFTAEVGYWLGEPFWNKGIITKALKLFCSYLFANYNFNRLTAKVYEGNDASKRVLEKTGFVLEGTQRKAVYKDNLFLDLHLYGLLKKDFIL